MQYAVQRQGGTQLWTWLSNKFVPQGFQRQEIGMEESTARKKNGNNLGFFAAVILPEEKKTNKFLNFENKS